MLRHYAPRRVWKAFQFLLTIFLLVRRQERFFWLTPLTPIQLKNCVLSLGICFIKLAQVLATRADFFSEDYLRQLKTILDEVEPMSSVDFRIMFDRAFGVNPPFCEFDDEPLASASIGQVHRATLHDGTPVAVKLRRRGITLRVASDLRILRTFLQLFKPFFTSCTKNSLDAVLTEFSAMIRKEIDLAIELENLRKFAATYVDSGVRFPQPYATNSSSLALVMSFETGTRIDDYQELRRNGVDFAELMERLVIFYTEQMLVKGFFHADPHPGNLLVHPDGTIVLLDFGMVKRLPKSARVAMIELVKAANEQEFELFITAAKRLGVVAASAPMDQMFELAEHMFDIFNNENLNAASMRELAFDTLASMKNLPFKLPQEVVYVMRVSTLLEGLGTGFIENFNGVKDILPILRRNLHRALGAQARLFPTISGELRDLPLTVRRIKSVIADLSDSNLEVRVAQESLEFLADRQRIMLKGLAVGAFLVLAAFFLLQLDISWRREAAALLFLAGILRAMVALR